MRNKIFSNFIWRFAERCGARIVEFVVTIVLARILLPEHYGTVALLNVFISIFRVFVNCGLGSALIQKYDADDLDFSSVFFFNIGFSVILYVLLFCAAPFIAKFYDNQELTNYVRVMGIVLIIAGVKNVQSAYVSRNLIFKRFFFATLAGTIGAAILGIWMALNGFGVWALITQSLFNNTVDTIILWITVKWRPKKIFSFERLKGLLSFGWKLLVSSLLDTVYNNLRSLIIGKKYSSEDLAYYNRGNEFPAVVTDNIISSIDSVLLPAMSKVQNDPELVKNMTRRSITVSTFIIAPFMMGLAFIAETMIHVVLTDKWLPAVPYLRIFCITYMFYPIHTANLNAIKAMGRSDMYLKLEVLKKGIGLFVLFISMNISVKAMAYSMIFTSITSQIINTYPNLRLLNYSYVDQLKDILPNLGIAVVMGFLVSFLGKLPIMPISILLIQVLAGAIIYILLSTITKNASFFYLLSIIKERK